jgi:hypothetical protein
VTETVTDTETEIETEMVSAETQTVTETESVNRNCYRKPNKDQLISNAATERMQSPFLSVYRVLRVLVATFTLTGHS